MLQLNMKRFLFKASEKFIYTLTHKTLILQFDRNYKLKIYDFSHMTIIELEQLLETI